MLTVGCGAMPNETRVHRFPRHRCNMVSLSIWRVYLVAVRSLDKEFLLTMIFNSGWISAEFKRLTSAPVSRKAAAACIALTDFLHVILIL